MGEIKLESCHRKEGPGQDPTPSTSTNRDYPERKQEESQTGGKKVKLLKGKSIRLGGG